jgi:hypothetical protein
MKKHFVADRSGLRDTQLRGAVPKTFFPDRHERKSLPLFACGSLSSGRHAVVARLRSNLLEVELNYVEPTTTHPIVRCARVEK